ncbi:MAG: glycosyltransferase, partial [Cyclobacteriaceae bacterium]
MMKTSVVIIVKNRTIQLSNTLYGISQQERLPDEVVIIHMNEDTPAVNYDDTKLIQQSLWDNKVAIPLGKARNMGADTASGDLILFLDVDCIPSTDWLVRMQEEVRDFDGLLMGDISYLNKSETDRFTEERSDLTGMGESLPFRPATPMQGKITDADYSLFWSLNFGISKKNFFDLRGFDEDFVGYGAEDTDFAFRARTAELPFGICGAK